MSVVDIYKRLGRALKRGQGVRLSAEELITLVWEDDAVGRALAGCCGVDDVTEMMKDTPT